MNALPSLPNLTPNERVWRLDWFGECAYPGSVRRYAQPSIKVVLSSLRGDPTDHSALLFADGTDHQHPHETWAPIAALPMLAIGDLWQHGRQIASPDYLVESFKGLEINPDTASFVKAGLAIDGHFLLPLSYHPWHRLHTQSYCVAVDLDARRRLLVPCVELIRFYFGSSGNFLQRLFTVPLAQENLWSSKRLNPATRHLHLVLANRLSGLSASDIGRIAESKFAWRAAAGIYASCQKASAQGHAVYPYTGFPFEGATDLVVSGVWLPFGEQEHSTFLAYRLRSCSYPFPFGSLSYEAGDRKVRHTTSSERKSEVGKSLYSHSEQQTAAAETDPGRNNTPRSGSFTTQRRFPDLVRKQVWREKIESIPNADVFLLRNDGRLELVAYGDSDSVSSTPGIDVSQTSGNGLEAQNDRPLPWFVRRGLKAIATDPVYASIGLVTKVICPVGKSAPVFSLPVLVNEDGVIANELLFAAANGSTRLRRGCFAEVFRRDSLAWRFLILEGATRTDRPKVTSVNCVDLKSAAAIAIESGSAPS